MSRPSAAAKVEQARLDAMLAEVDEFDDIDAAYEEVRQKPYGFTWECQKWVLPHIRSLDWRTQQKIEDADGLGMQDIFDLFGDMFGPLQAERWKDTVQPSDKLPLLFARWLAHSKVKQGEDEASNDSSENTGENSRPTSDPSTDSDSLKPSSVPTAAELAALQPANS